MSCSSSSAADGALAYTSSSSSLDPQFVLLAIILLPLYLVFLSTERERVLRQRCFIQRIRNWLSVRCGLVNLTRAGQGWDNPAGVRMLACIWLACLITATSTLMFEGNVQFWGALSSTMLGAYCVVENKPRHVIVRIARVAMAQQALGVWVMLHLQFADVCDPVYLAPVRRAAVMRSIMALLLFESLEENFINMLVFSVIAQHAFHNGAATPEQRDIVLLPMFMFVFGIAPFHLLGANETVMALVKESDFSPKTALKLLRSISFFACVLPIHIYFSAYIGQSGRWSGLALAVTFLAAGVQLRTTPGLAVWLNRLIAPHTMMFLKPHDHHHPPLTGGSSITSSSHAHVHFSLAAALHYDERVVMPLLVSLAMADRYIAFLLVVSVATVALVHEDGQLLAASVGKLLVLSGWALGIEFVRDWAADNGSGGVRAVWMPFMLTFMGISAVFLCVLSSCVREIVYSKIARENQTEAFLSHAIKQKFASVGAAVEQILMGKEARASPPPLLLAVMDECRMGHARCYASSIYRKLTQGESRGAWKRQFANLRHQVEHTTMANQLVGSGEEHTKFDASTDRLRVQMDWEVFHLVLTKLARKRRRIERVSFVPDVALGDEQAAAAEYTGRLVLQLDQPVISMNLILAQLAEETNCQVDAENHALLCFRVKAQQQQPREQRRSSNSSSSSSCDSGEHAQQQQQQQDHPHQRHHRQDLHHLEERGASAQKALKTLRFALVDDNALIRKNFERLLRNNLGVPQANILTLGRNAAECRAFVRHICSDDNDVDVAIFDQNLDFDGDDDDDNNLVGGGPRKESYLKGSDLAQEAKRLGFSGCLILHSSDVNLGELRDQGQVFHGAVEKSANSMRFVEGLVDSWLNYTSQRRVL